MSEQESAPVKPVPEMASASEAKPALHQRVVDWLFAPWMRDEAASSYDWQRDAHLAYIEQQPLRARKILYAVARSCDIACDLVCAGENR